MLTVPGPVVTVLQLLVGHRGQAKVNCIRSASLPIESRGVNSEERSNTRHDTDASYIVRNGGASYNVHFLLLLKNTPNCHLQLNSHPCVNTIPCSQWEQLKIGHKPLLKAVNISRVAMRIQSLQRIFYHTRRVKYLLCSTHPHTIENLS